MRLRDGDPDRLQVPALPAELAVARSLGQPVVDVARQEFGRGVLAGKLGNGIEVLVVQRLEHCLQDLVGAADVDHDPIGVERIGHEGCIEDEGRAVQGLGGAKDFSLEGVSDHDVVADLDSVHSALLRDNRYVGRECHFRPRRWPASAREDP